MFTSLPQSRFLALGILALAAIVLAGCETLSYYSQSVAGQLEVLGKRRPLAEVIDDAQTPTRVRQQLELIRDARRFAVDELQLPDNASYTAYADLERKHVVWNVFATPELSVNPVDWCFVIVGCVVYRGYFHEQDARDYAAKLKGEGFDTFVAGINAYSTLGWFSDPVLNTFIHYPRARLAGLIFHELTHQKIYIKGDSVFNESLATAVELEGIKRWLRRNNSTGEQDAVRRQLARSDEVNRLMLDTRGELEAIYAQNLSDTAKRVAKRKTFATMRERYQALRQSWDGYAGYDAWFEQDFNNAYLVSAATYRSKLPAFEALFEQLNGDVAAFWEQVESLAKLDEQRRKQALDTLSP